MNPDLVYGAHTVHLNINKAHQCNASCVQVVGKLGAAEQVVGGAAQALRAPQEREEDLGLLGLPARGAYQLCLFSTIFFLNLKF